MRSNAATWTICAASWGDLLFHVVFHSQLARERGAFNFDDVVCAICDKMERRHPHVFGAAHIEDADAQNITWEEHKRRERSARGESVLGNVPVALPALTRAGQTRQARGAGGF